MRNNLAYSANYNVHQDAPELSFPLHHAVLLQDQIDRGVIYVNNDGVLAYMNRYAREALNVDRDAIIGKTLDMLPLRTPLYRLLSEPCHELPLEIVVYGRTYAAKTSSVCADDGLLNGEITELWDITDEKRIKKEWEEFVAMTTHDLRSPLTVIMGFIQGMKCGMYGEVDGRLLSLIKMAEDSGNCLNSMIEEMLDNFRLVMGLLDLDRQSCDIVGLLEKCYRDNLRIAQAQGVELLMSPIGELPEAIVDSKQLTRVFNNLVSNAIKYTPSPGTAMISATLVNDVLCVEISDTGIGIPVEDYERIFTKYYRSAGAARFKGTGLGLTICKTIVEAHGGNIRVASTLGKGSKFTVSIPFVSQMENVSEVY